MKKIIFIAASLLATCLPAQHVHDMHMEHHVTAPMPAIYAGDADKPGAPVFTGLGDHKHPISTKNPETQKFFDQGINLLFAFNHAEAIRSFREAARQDPNCAMCWWGVAFALGPNINLPMMPDSNAPALEALAKAQALSPQASDEERAWINALATRYSADPKADRMALDEAFAAAMRNLWKKYPDNLDAGVFYAEAMMDTQAWNYWEPDGKTPRGHGADIIATLEQIIKKEPNHPGALHLYIHAVEASTNPERAESAADRLQNLMPEAGHIVHMPSHIYYRVGRYEDAVRLNELAAKVDENFIATIRAQGFYPIMYYPHNIHFLWTSSEMLGRQKASLDAARRLVDSVKTFQKDEIFAGTEPFVFAPIATMVRFGQWNEILVEPIPSKSLALTYALVYYARGFAHANLNDISAAKEDRNQLAELAKGDFTKYEAFMIPAKQMVELSLQLLDGEIARVSGNLPDAINHFVAAQKLERDLPYMEPPFWHQPVAHVLGAAYIQAGNPVEAEKVYRESLKVYRVDGWAFFGLYQALLAQGKTDEAEKVKQQYDEAWKTADVKLKASRF